jgi:hypothetical protein
MAPASRKPSGWNTLRWRRPSSRTLGVDRDRGEGRGPADAAEDDAKQKLIAGGQERDTSHRDKSHCLDIGQRRGELAMVARWRTPLISRLVGL